VIHWLSKSEAKAAQFNLYDRLFTVPNPGAQDDFAAVINPLSLTIKHGFVEPALAQAKELERFQFERTGYFCADLDSRAEKLVFNRTVELRDTWAKVSH
jgi:glutaminyl-tRNA synthetase